MKIIEVITDRGDSLFGCLYGEQFKDTCVIITNGMGGNIFENKFLRVLGEELERNKISYICAHNSGAFQSISFPSLNNNISGLCYETFDNCYQDLDAYVKYAKKMGYKNIILGGHSYGCNKVIYYLHKTNSKDISKYILLAPCDMKVYSEEELKSIKEYLPIANKLKEENNLDKIIPIQYAGSNFYTARAFFDLIDNPNHDNLPIYTDSKGWKQLKTINAKGLYIMGKNDMYANKDTFKHLNTINNNSKYKNNEIKVVEGTGHTYKNKEKELSQLIIDFIESNKQL